MALGTGLNYAEMAVLAAGRPVGHPQPGGLALDGNYPAVSNPSPAVLTELSPGYETLSEALKRRCPRDTDNRVYQDRV